MNTEPVSVTEALRLVLVALVSVGWLTISDTTINVLVSAVAAVLSVVLSVVARGRVTPVLPPSPPLDGPNHALRDD